MQRTFKQKTVYYSKYSKTGQKAYVKRVKNYLELDEIELKKTTPEIVQEIETMWDGVEL